MDNIQEIIYSSLAGPSIVPLCARCKSPAAGCYKCETCFQAELVCRSCCIEQHKHNPLHRVRKWKGAFFERQDLSELGLVMKLGHNGQPCPPPSYHARISSPTPWSYDRRPSTIRVVHTNGQHKVAVQYCECSCRPQTDVCPEKNDDFTQLLRAGFFPATTKSPQTAFTFSLLTQHRALFRCAKLSTLDFARAITRLSYSTGIWVDKPNVGGSYDAYKFGSLTR